MGTSGGHDMDGIQVQSGETMQMRGTFGSLFAGVGGFDLGFERAGWRCRFQVEWDKHCRNVLDRHWPDVPKWGDVSTVSGYELPPVECIIFGSPCQDLSVAGKRAGLDGARSGLFFEAVRIIKEMRDATGGTFPRWTVWENVAGALSSNQGRDFGAVVGEMVEAGAVLQEYALLDAQHFGVPQRRRRVFLVSVFDTATASRCPDPLLPVGESVRGNTSKGKQKGQTVTGTTAAGFGSGSFGGWTETDTAITLSARDHKSSNTIAVESFTGTSHAQYGEGVGTIRANGGDLGGGSETLLVEPFVKSRRAQTSDDDETWIPAEVTPTLNSFDVGDTRATTAIVEPMLIDGTRVDDVRVYEPPVQTLKERMGTGGNNVPVIGIQGNVIGREPHNGPQGKGHTEEGDPMFTLTSTDIHEVTQQMVVRRLTPLECERLMGWPDDHTRWKADGTEQADTHRYKQCGNGVASPVAQWIAQHMRTINESF